MKKTIIYRRIAFVAAVALLVILIGFQILPLTFNEPDLINQTSLQSMRTQRMAKDALTLAYRPDTENSQAISELQNTLPAWEAQQKFLHKSKNADISTLVNQSQPDYIAVDTAVKKLLDHPTGKVDITQVEIILDHERNYSLLMSQISALIQDRIQSFNLDLIIIQVGITVLITTTTIAIFVLSDKKERSQHG